MVGADARKTARSKLFYGAGPSGEVDELLKKIAYKHTPTRTLLMLFLQVFFFDKSPAKRHILNSNFIWGENIKMYLHVVNMASLCAYEVVFIRENCRGKSEKL